MASPAAVEAPQSAPEAPAAPELAAVEWAPDPRLADATAAAVIPTTEAPSPDPATVEGAPASKPAAAEIPTDWKAKLEAGDPEFLSEFEKHPKVLGFIAGRADFLAKQQRALEAKAEMDAKLDKAAEEDPNHPLSQARLAERQQQQATQTEVDSLGKTFTTARMGVAAFVTSLDEDARAEIAKLAPEGKLYGQPGDLVSGIKEYMADVVKGVTAAELTKAKAEWAKTELPAMFKDYLAERGETERSPDLGTNALPAGGATGLSQEKLDNMSPSQWAKWIAVPANKAAYNQFTSTLGQAA